MAMALRGSSFPRAPPARRAIHGSRVPSPPRGQGGTRLRRGSASPGAGPMCGFGHAWSSLVLEYLCGTRVGSLGSRGGYPLAALGIARIGVTRSTQACFLAADRQCTELPLLRLPRLVHTSFASFLFARWCRSVPSLLYIYYTTRFLPPAYFTRLQCNNNTRSVFLSRISLSV